MQLRGFTERYRQAGSGADNEDDGSNTRPAHTGVLQRPRSCWLYSLQSCRSSRGSSSSITSGLYTVDPYSGRVRLALGEKRGGGLTAALFSLRLFARPSLAGFNYSTNDA